MNINRDLMSYYLYLQRRELKLRDMRDLAQITGIDGKR
jgi:hypothetical protein